MDGMLKTFVWTTKNNFQLKSSHFGVKSRTKEAGGTENSSVASAVTLFLLVSIMGNNLPKAKGLMERV